MQIEELEALEGQVEHTKSGSPYVDVRGVHPLYVNGQRACSLQVPGSQVHRSITVQEAKEIADRLNP